MPLPRLTAAATILALTSAAHAQDLMLFPAETFGQVVAPRNESLLGDVQLEAQVGAYNNEFISNYGTNSIFARTGRSVGMLQILTNVGHAPCTGFLVEGNRIVTNHHCVPGILKHPKMQAQGATSIAAVQFHAGFTRDGLEDGVKTFHVNPVPLETSEALDYTVLQVLGDANTEFGALELTAAVPQDRDPFWVIGHPMGEAQRISREKCQAGSPAVAKQRLRHTCDTLPGNSGSPVIDAGSQKVIALHHAGSRVGQVNFAVPMAEILAQSKVLTAVMPVKPKPVQPDTGELNAAFALSDALALEDRVERIAALEALLREFGKTRAAKRAERMLEADRTLLQDDSLKTRSETERALAAATALQTALSDVDLEARISGLEQVIIDFPDTRAAETARLLLSASPEQPFFSPEPARGASNQPGYCNAPDGPTESSICREPDLWEDEIKLIALRKEELLGKKGAERGEILIRHIKWKKLRDECDSNLQCIAGNTRLWLAELDEFDGLPPTAELIAKASQKQLNRLACGAGEPDGVLGSKTALAVERLEIATGAPVAMRDLDTLEGLAKLKAHETGACSILFAAREDLAKLSGLWEGTASCGPNADTLANVRTTISVEMRESASGALTGEIKGNFAALTGSLVVVHQERFLQLSWQKSWGASETIQLKPGQYPTELVGTSKTEKCKFRISKAT